MWTYKVLLTLFMVLSWKQVLLFLKSFRFHSYLLTKTYLLFIDFTRRRKIYGFSNENSLFLLFKLSSG